MLHIWFNQTQSHSLIWNRLLPPSIPLLLCATSHDRLYSCLWLLIIEIFLARFRLHLKNVFKAKAFSINLPTASQPQKKNRHRILFIYIEQGEQVAPSLLPLTYLLPRPWSQSVKRRGGKKGCWRWQEGGARGWEDAKRGRKCWGPFAAEQTNQATGKWGRTGQEGAGAAGQRLHTLCRFYLQQPRVKKFTQTNWILYTFFMPVFQTKHKGTCLLSAPQTLLQYFPTHARTADRLMDG